MHFQDNGFKLYLGILCVGHGFISDGFIVLDVVCNNVIACSCFSYITSSSDHVNIDDHVWHACLGHIGQDMINRVAKADIEDTTNII